MSDKQSIQQQAGATRRGRGRPKGTTDSKKRKAKGKLSDEFGFWSEFANTLPAKPTPDQDVRIPHMGIPGEVAEFLLKHGYKPIDLRLMPPSEELYELMVKGALLGLFKVDQQQVALMRQEGSRLGLFEKDRKRVSVETTHKDLETLLGELASQLPVTPKKRSESNLGPLRGIPIHMAPPKTPEEKAALELALGAYNE